MKKVLKEWDITAPWGKIALVSWGNPSGYPVLLVHGREDSVATFIPLLELLPDDYYFVGLDLPGCGKSDQFPYGINIMRFTNVVAVDIVVRHLRWPHFHYIAHSMGTEIGVFLNAIYPHRISKMLLIDPLPAWYKLQVESFPEYFKKFYTSHYDDYARRNAHDRVYTRERALAAVRRARGVNPAQAALLLSRSMTRVGEDEYRLSWDKRQKLPVPWNLDDDSYVKIFSQNCPPTLLISVKNQPIKDIGKTVKLMERIRDCSRNFEILYVDGDHDVHFKHPERFIREALAFLKKDFSMYAVAKL